MTTGMTGSPVRTRVLLAALCACSLLALIAGAGVARAASSGWWTLNVSSAPTILVPGEEGIVVLSAANVGYAAVSGSSVNPIVFRDTLPASLEVTKVFAEAGRGVESEGRENTRLTCTRKAGPTAETATYSCPFTGSVEQTESISAEIFVKPSAAGQIEDTLSVSGGNSESAPAVTRTIHVADEPTRFGVERYEVLPETDEGKINTQAGAHPFQLTTVFDLNESIEELAPEGGRVKEKFPAAAALPKNLHFLMPAGLVAKAAHVPECTGANFATLTPGAANLCPGDSAIGYAVVTVNDPATLGYFHAAVPVFNLTHELGEPARFGFTVHDVPVLLTTRVLSGKSYDVEVTVHEATENSSVLDSQVTLWGTPEDSRHDSERGWECLEGGWWVSKEKPCKPKDSQTPEAFLTMPAYCATNASERESTVTGEAWDGETSSSSEEGARFTFPPFTGCPELPFEPSISVTPDHPTASTPSGFTVDVDVPQSTTLAGVKNVLTEEETKRFEEERHKKLTEEETKQLVEEKKNLAEKEVVGEADVRSTTLTLPPGVVASGGAADGLLTCSAAGFGFEGVESELTRLTENDHFDENQVEPLECPEAAKIGTVEIETPLLEEKLEGSVYLAKADTNPFESPLYLYIFAETEKSKVQVKLAGEVELGEHGQLTSVFKDTPSLPFSKLSLHLLDGSRAAQSTPETCGEYTAQAAFTASSGVAHEAQGSFQIEKGADGGPCPTAGTQFSPSFEAGSTSPGAGEFSPFVVKIERPDSSQPLKSISITEPPGASAMLSSVTPCPIAQAEAEVPVCPEGSKVGTSTALAGLGSDAEKIQGEVYLTEGFDGAPFGLLDVSDATKVGPFNLGYISVLSRITVNETTAQATVTTDTEGEGTPHPLPEYVKGVPAQIKALVVDVNRPGFAFNPTSCQTLETTGTLSGFQNGLPAGSEQVEHLDVANNNCGSLPFDPSISVSVESNVSRVEGTGMKIVVKSSRGQANIHKTKLVFPNTVPSRLTTIQKACPDYVFDANPASCDEGSVIGSAVAHTPVLKSPLTGPVYLVSHAGAEFPDAEFVLQGEGIKLLLDGKTNIKGGVTSSTFETVPDAPVETFEVDLQRGPHSAFSGYGNLCEKPIEVPTTFGGQNGALIESETKVDVEGCSGVKAAKAESELAKLLKQCKKVTAKHGKRAKCEATARKQHKAVATCKKKYKGKAKKLASCEAAARKRYALKLK